MAKILFLPGAGGSPDFWKPVAKLLPGEWPWHHFGWAGLGDQPHDPAVRGLDDIVAMVLARLSEPADLVAQSMGGVVAARIAIERPDLVRRLVLCATSGGVDMAGLGAADWRPAYRQSFPDAAEWITSSRVASDLPVEKIAAPTLLIWGDADPISPVAVGRHLNLRIAGSRLEIVPGGDHDVAVTHAGEVAPLIRRWLSAPAH